MNEWQSWVGRTMTSVVHLDAERANLMAATLDRPPEHDVGDPVPPGWHWLYAHDAVRAGDLGPDGHPALGVIMPPVPFERRMWASGSLVFEGALRLGDEASWTRTISDVVLKDGRSGPLAFVTVLHDIGVAGERRVQEEQNIVYRALAARSAEVVAPPAPADAEYSRAWSLDGVALFRYSALSFNGHRIHYDVDYARDVEGYRDLVVHGPLLASLLMDLGQEEGGELASFSYRARSPLFRSDDFVTAGRGDGRGGASLWAASTDGRLAMDAQATYQETS